MFKIYIKCSWCGKDMGSKATNIKQEPGMDITHGICKECFKIEIAKLENKKGEMNNEKVYAQDRK